MGKIIKFRKRKKPQLPDQWQPYVSKKKPKLWHGAIAVAILGLLFGIWSLQIGRPGWSRGSIASLAETSQPSPIRRFGLCHIGGGRNCVVDGDTIWMDGVKIRIADIDAPETHPPRCPYEADLGNKATRRLHQLLNSGPVEAKRVGTENSDQYGRKLRILWQNAKSVGAILIAEGLARPWTGGRRPWC